MSTKKNEKQTALSAPIAAPQNGGSALAPIGNGGDELAALGVEFGDDGLGEIDREDIKIPAKVINFKGTDAKTGRKIQEDAYYDTVEETAKDTIDAVFLHLHKTNMWSEFDTVESRTQIKCRSFDRITGTMDDGTVRKCEGCPDAQWRTDENGKRGRRCGPVYNMFAVDRETQQPFVIRFKRTSLPVVKSYLQKYFINRRVMSGGKRANYPLFAFPTVLTTKMSDDGKYALPVLSRGELLEIGEIQAHAETQKFVRANLGQLERIEVQAETQEVAAPDTSFDPDKFTSDQGQDVSVA